MKCQNCGEVEIPEPEYCCSGYMCGCMGLPIDPPLCEKCFDKIINRSDLHDPAGPHLIPGTRQAEAE